MSNTTYNIRIDKQIRDKADALYKSMGLSLSSAINLFLTQSVIQGKLPINEVIAEPSYADALLCDANTETNDHGEYQLSNKHAISYAKINEEAKKKVVQEV